MSISDDTTRTPDVSFNPPPEKKSNRTMIIIIVLVVLLCCCCVCVFGSSMWLYNNYDSLGDPFGVYGALRLALSTL